MTTKKKGPDCLTRSIIASVEAGREELRTLLQFQVLMCISKKAGVTLAELMTVLGRSQSGVHASLVMLEGRKLISTRQIQGTNRPLHAYSLTTHGVVVMASLLSLSKEKQTS